LTKIVIEYKMKIDKGSDSMVKVNIKNSQEITTWGGYLSNHTIIKQENKYENKLEDPSL